MSDDDSSEQQHPALKGDSRFVTQAKYVAVKALKWAAIGAAVVLGGSLLLGAVGGGMVGGAVGTALSTIVPPLAPLFTTGGMMTGGLAGISMVLSHAVPIALYGAGVIGGIGAVVGLTGASEAADADEDRKIMKYEQAQARQERVGAMAMRRDQQAAALNRQTLAMSPGANLPRGRSTSGPAYT